MEKLCVDLAVVVTGRWIYIFTRLIHYLEWYIQPGVNSGQYLWSRVAYMTENGKHKT